MDSDQQRCSHNDPAKKESASEVQKLSAENALLHTQINSLRDNLNKRTDELNSLFKKWRSGNISLLLKEREELNNKLSAREKTIENLNSRLSHISEELLEQNRDAIAEKNRKSSNFSSQKTSRDQDNFIADRIDRIGQTLINSINKIEKNRFLQSDDEEKKQEQEELREKVLLLQSELDTIKHDKEKLELEKKLEESLAESDFYKNKCREILEEKENWEKQKKQEFEVLEMKLSKIEVSTQKQLSILEEKYSLLEQISEGRQKEIERQKIEIQQLQKKSELLQKNYDQHKKNSTNWELEKPETIQEKENTIEHLQKIIENIKISEGQKITPLEDKINTLKNENAKLFAEILLLKEDLKQKQVVMPQEENLKKLDAEDINSTSTKEDLPSLETSSVQLIPKSETPIETSAEENTETQEPTQEPDLPTRPEPAQKETSEEQEVLKTSPIRMGSDDIPLPESLRKILEQTPETQEQESSFPLEMTLPKALTDAFAVNQNFSEEKLTPPETTENLGVLDQTKNSLSQQEISTSKQEKKEELPAPYIFNPPAQEVPDLLKNKHHIYLVEPQEQPRLIMHKALVKDGHEVHSSSEGGTIFEYIESNHPDILIFNATVNDVDGYQVLSDLKNHPLSKNLPVILVATNQEATLALLESQHLTNIKNVLYKPFSVKELLKMVHWVAFIDNPKAA